MVALAVDPSGGRLGALDVPLAPGAVGPIPPLAPAGDTATALAGSPHAALTRASTCAPSCSMRAAAAPGRHDTAALVGADSITYVRSGVVGRACATAGSTDAIAADSGAASRAVCTPTSRAMKSAMRWTVGVGVAAGSRGSGRDGDQAATFGATATLRGAIVLAGATLAGVAVTAAPRAAGVCAFASTGPSRSAGAMNT